MDVRQYIEGLIADTQRRFDTDAADEFIGECRWLLLFMDGKLSAKETAYLAANDVHTVQDAAAWIGFNLQVEG